LDRRNFMQFTIGTSFAPRRPNMVINEGLLQLSVLSRS
jgi:hypothetical protein